MSDPAKSPEEIEDVLASIRRLVSDHGGSNAAPAPAPAPAAKQPARPQATGSVAQPDAADALVLTPSFRVSDPDDPWIPVPAAAEEEEDDLAAALISDVVAADAADAAEQSADWQPDDRLARFDIVGGEDALSDEDEAAPDPTGHHGDDFDIEAEGPELAEAPSDIDMNLDAPEDVSEDDIADLGRLDGAMPEQAMAEFESDTGDENWPGDGAEAALLSLVARRDPVADDMAEMPVDVAFDESPFDDSAPDAAAETFEASPPEDHHDEAPEMAAPDATVEIDPAPEMHAEEVDHPVAEAHPDAQDLNESEPETDHDDAADASRPIFSRRGQADAPHMVAPDTLEAEAKAEAEDLGAEPSPFSFPDPEDGILDEDTLREIIVDVVREELQGVLGQRITRNVRKMVRREIRLALAAEDLE